MPAWLRQIAWRSCLLSQAGTADQILSQNAARCWEQWQAHYCLSCVLNVFACQAGCLWLLLRSHTWLQISVRRVIVVTFANDVMFLLVHCQNLHYCRAEVNSPPLSFRVRSHHSISSGDLSSSKGKVSGWFTCPVFYRIGNTRTPKALFF